MIAEWLAKASTTTMLVAAIGAVAPNKVGAAPATGSSSSTLSGVWEMRLSDASDGIQLRLTSKQDPSQTMEVSSDELLGVRADCRARGPKDIRFVLRRDAGTLSFEGTCRSQVGAGTFDFVPNSQFVAELSRSGINWASPSELLVLLTNDIGFAFLAEKKLDRSEMAELVRAAQHGMDLESIRRMNTEMSMSMDMRSDMDAQMEKVMCGDMEMEVDPHMGMDTRMRSATLSSSAWDAAREHGVDRAFVRGMSALGYRNLTIEQLIRLRDHGVTPEWARRQNERNRVRLTPEELIRLRDRGAQQ